MGPRRIGWLALAAISALLGVASLLGAVWQFGLAVGDGSLGDLVAPIAGAACSVVFWRWIGLGAWERAHPALDPDTGEPLAPSEPVGPWGWVGRFLLALIVVGLVGVGTWASVETRRQDRETQRLQDRIEQVARRNELSVGQVDAAAQGHRSWLATGGGLGADPLVGLLAVPGATVQDAEVVDGVGRVLVRPDRGLPCIVLDVRATGAITTTQTEAC